MLFAQLGVGRLDLRLAAFALTVAPMRCSLDLVGQARTSVALGQLRRHVRRPAFRSTGAPPALEIRPFLVRRLARVATRLHGTLKTLFAARAYFRPRPQMGSAQLGRSISWSNVRAGGLFAGVAEKLCYKVQTGVRPIFGHQAQRFASWGLTQCLGDFRPFTGELGQVAAADVPQNFQRLLVSIAERTVNASSAPFAPSHHHVGMFKDRLAQSEDTVGLGEGGPAEPGGRGLELPEEAIASGS